MYDAQIREPLFDYLDEKYPKNRIFEEKIMGKSRADIVMVLDGSLAGLEIKSDADTYTRLERQVADYDLYFKEGYAAPVSVSAFADGIRDFFEKPDEVLITKQTKKSERVLDIKPLIYGFQVTDRGGVPSFYLKLSTGSTDNLKPELVFEALFLHMGLTYDPNAIQIHRKDVYASDGDDFVSLGAMGEVIE